MHKGYSGANLYGRSAPFVAMSTAAKVGTDDGEYNLQAPKIDSKPAILASNVDGANATFCGDTERMALKLFEDYATRDRQATTAFPSVRSTPIESVDGVHDTFVISMGQDGRRWKAAQKRLTAAGFPRSDFRRWPAVDGNALSNDALASAIVHPRALYTIENMPLCLYDVETWGTIGCYLSHWSLWYYVASNQVPAILVFEDDVVPRWNIVRDKLPQMISSLVKEAGGTSNFDIMRFEWMGFDKNVRERHSANLYRSKGLVVNMGAYIITLRGARKLLRHAMPVNDPIDMLLAFTERTHDKDFVSLLSRHILTVQDRRNFDSQIASDFERVKRHRSLCSIDGPKSPLIMMSQVAGDSRSVASRSLVPGFSNIALALVGLLAIALIVTIVCLVYFAQRVKKLDTRQLPAQSTDWQYGNTSNYKP